MQEIKEWFEQNWIIGIMLLIPIGVLLNKIFPNNISK